MNPYPDENSWWNTFTTDVNGKYGQAQHPLDDGRFKWFSRTAYDIAAGLTADTSRAKHLRELDIELGLTPPPDPVPPLAMLTVENGRFKAGTQCIVPRFLSEFDVIPLLLRGDEAEVRRRFERAKQARCNGVRGLGMWVNTEPDAQFSPRSTGYWTAADRAVTLSAEYGLYFEYPFFADAQKIVPAHSERVAWLQDYAAFVNAHPTVVPQLANEPAFNGWTEVDDPKFLELGAMLHDLMGNSRAHSLGDPVDVGVNGNTAPEVIARFQKLAAISNVLVLHDSRETSNDGRYARWVDHLKGMAELLEQAELWGLRAIIHDEPMGMAHEYDAGRRDNRVVAHVAGALMGALMGGYTCHYISIQDDGVPGLLESAIAADIPGSPDFEFINATLDGSPVKAFTGFDKVRTLTNGREHYAVAYGRRGTLTWDVPETPQLVQETTELDQNDREWVVQFWKAA